MGKDLPKVTQGGRGRAGLEVSLCECQWLREPQHLGLVPSFSLAGHGSLRSPPYQHRHSFREAAVPSCCYGQKPGKKHHIIKMTNPFTN